MPYKVPEKNRTYRKKYWKKWYSQKQNRERHRKNSLKRAKILPNQWRKELRIMFGNKCERCGYNKCKQALEFHHRNEKNKKFTICHATRNLYKKQDIINEAKKCILLCANCHREKENSLW